LGVVCLAIDTSTHLVGRSAPEGILYTGGRDGLVMSWDLRIPMKKRQHGTRGLKEDEGFRRPVGRWQLMTGWGDEAIDDEAEEAEVKPIDGDVLGDVLPGGGRRKKRVNQIDSIPHGREWETDVDAFRPGKACSRLLSRNHLTAVHSNLSFGSAFKRTAIG
jgi:WD repeat-containing protein 48